MEFIIGLAIINIINKAIKIHGIPPHNNIKPIFLPIRFRKSKLHSSIINPPLVSLIALEGL